MNHSAFSFSTSWNAGSHSDALSLVREINSLGFERIELNFTLSKKIVDGIKKLVRDKKVIVTSVHNFCPVPEELVSEAISPDYYNLASLDESTRLKAIGLAKATIETAKSVGATAVILHLGRVEVKDGTRDLAIVVGDGKNYPKVKALMERERSEKSHTHMEKAIEALAELSKYAKAKDIKLGIENRFYYREIPNIEEIGLIMKRFSPSDNIFYWHDVGHARVFENLGLVGPNEYLERFKERLAGMHIHDVDFIDDHRAPGKGNIDFSGLLKYIKSDTLLVFEIHKKSEASDIVKGKAYLEGLLKKF